MLSFLYHLAQRTFRKAMKPFCVPALMHFKPIKQFNERYSHVQLLGKGQFSVDLVRDVVVQGDFAAKTVPIDEDGYYLREFEVLSVIRHPNIVNLYSCFKDKSFVVYLMEYVGDQSLQDLMTNERLDETSVKDLYRPLVDAVVYLHCDAQIYHGDIKV